MREKKECAIVLGIEVEQSKDGRKVKYLENNICLIKKMSEFKLIKEETKVALIKLI